MSVVFVNAGQCGNQVGFDVIDSIFEHLSSPPDTTASSSPPSRTAGRSASSSDAAPLHPMDGLDAFFRPSSSTSGYTARAVCVDTEPKVVLSCMSQCRRRGWRFDPARAVFSHGGAGNNWAMGYQMGSGKLLETALDSIRREMEHCDAPPLLLFSHSLGGGTGSGLGTRLCEEAADEFPESSRLNAAVMPYHFGEVIVQHYNSLLCLSKTSLASDGVMLFDNEVAHEVCRTGFGKEKPSLRDLNAVIAAGMMAAILPKYKAAATTDAHQVAPSVHSKRSFYSLNEQVAHLCSHPGYKFMDVKVVPQTSERSVAFTYDSWRALMGRLQRMETAGSASENVSRGGLQTSSFAWAEASGSAAVVEDDDDGDGQDESVAVSERTSRPDRAHGGNVQVASVLTLRGPDASEAASNLRVRATPDPISDTDATYQDASFSSSGSVVSAASRHRYASETHSSITRARPDHRTGGQAASEVSFQVQSSPWSQSVYGQTNGSVSVAYSTRSLKGYHRSASLISNGQSVLPLLIEPQVRAANMYRCGAYLHQYTDLGIERADFEEAFLNLGQVVQNYRSLSP